MSAPHKLASREWKLADSVVDVGGVRFGAGELTVIAGPCAVEGRESLWAAARAAKEGGARMLRGGAFKPRTSPYDFQGLGEEGVRLLGEASREFGLPAVTEARAAANIGPIARHCHMV